MIIYVSYGRRPLRRVGTAALPGEGCSPQHPRTPCGIEFWTDTGEGTFELRYIRDEQKREVDFLVLRNAEPWLLIEVKLADTQLSPNLAYFQKATGAQHAKNK